MGVLLLKIQGDRRLQKKKEESIIIYMMHK